MTRFTSIFFIILCFSILKGYSQDKLFLRNGTQVKGKILAISANTISYRDTIPNSQIITIPKGQVLLVEYSTGNVYIFASENKPVVTKEEGYETYEQRKERKMQEWKEKENAMPNNILGFYAPEIFLGRFTVSFERLLANKSVGIKIPFSLTYDFLGTLGGTQTTTSNGTTTTTATSRTRGTGFITGVDISYYHDLKPRLKYYFGPRVRYGTDMTLGGIEGLTVQLQNGIMRSSGDRFTSTLGFGIGFFKLSQDYAQYRNYDTKQIYPWASITWRLGFRL